MRAVVRRAYSVREEAEVIERYGELEKQDYLREWTVKNKLGILEAIRIQTAVRLGNGKYFGLFRKQRNFIRALQAHC